MVTAGSLNFVLGADTSQLQRQLVVVQQQAEKTAFSVVGLFSGNEFAVAGLQLAQQTLVDTIRDVDRLNAGFRLTDSITENLGRNLVGNQLFGTLLSGKQMEALSRQGLGDLVGFFDVLTTGSAVIIATQAALSKLEGSVGLLNSVFQAAGGGVQMFSNGFKFFAENADLVGKAIEPIAKTVDAVIQSILASLSAVNPAFKQLIENARQSGVDFNAGSAALNLYKSNLGGIKDAAMNASNGAKRLSESISSISVDAGGINKTQNTLTQLKASFAQTEKAASAFANAAFLFDSWQQANAIFERFFGTLEQSFNAAKSFEGLTNRLKAFSFSAGGAREDLAFLNETADELGADFDALAEGFTQFSASARLTNLSAEKTKTIFEDLTQATSVMKLSTGETSGVFLALRQMLSGGTVQLQELNQLAERLPGAFQAASAALGVTNSELRGLISTGKVLSEDFVPKFAAQLASSTDAGVVGAANSADAAINRFNNALGKLQIEMGKAWVEVGTPAINLFADALSFATKNEELFSTAIDAIGVAAIPSLVAALVAGSKAALMFLSTQGLLVGSTQQLAIAIKAQTVSLKILKTVMIDTIRQMGVFALQIGLAYAAMILVYRVMDRTADSAKSTRTAIKALKNSIAELSETAENTDLDNVLPKEPVPKDFVDGAIIGLRDMQSEGNAAQRVFATLFNTFGIGTAKGINALVTYFKTGKFEFTTFADKASNDVLAALGDFGSEVNAILGESLKLREQNILGDGPIKEVARLDAALKQLESRKLGIDPNDEKAVAAILAEETTLLEQRATAQEKILNIQSATNNAISQTKQQLQELDRAALGEENYESAKAQLETLLALLEREKTKFDEVADVAVTQTQTISDAYKETNKTIETAYSDRTVAIAEAVAAGELTEEQARQRSLAAEKEYLAQKLANNKSALEQLKTALEQDTALRAVDPNAAGLLTPEQLEQYQQQVEQLELNTAQTRIELAQTVTDEKKQLLEEELADLEQANAEAESAIDRSQNTRIAAIRQRQLAGALSEEQAQAEITAIEQQGIVERLAQKQSELSQIKNLKASGVLSAKEAADQERGILGEISELNLQRLEAEVQAQKAAEDAKKQAAEETLRAVERANAQAQQAIERSQNDRTVAIRQAQLAGVVSEEEAARQIEQIQRDSSAATIAQKEREIEVVRRLREQGVLSAEEAANKEAQLTQEIGNLNLQRIEQELQAQEQLKQAEIQRIEEVFQARQSKLESQTGNFDLRQGAVEGQLDLLNSQLELTDALGQLEQERLNTKIAQAEASGNEQAVDQLKEQQLRLQSQQIERQFEAQKQQLKLQQEIRKIELDREKVNARIAVLEAQANLVEAQAEGASQAKLNALQQILGLREQEVGAVDDAIARQDELNRLQDENLSVQQQINRERQRQSEIQAEGERRQRQEQASDSDSNSNPEGNGTNTGSSSTRSDGGISYTTYSTRSSSSPEPSFDSATQYRGADGRIMNRRINAAGSAFATSRSLLEGAIPSDSPLRSSGGLAAAAMSGKEAIVQKIDDLRIVSKLDELKASILQLANSPRSLTVQAPDPIKDMGAILGTVAAQRTKAARL